MNHTSLLSLTLPGGQSFSNPTGLNSQFVDLASILSALLNVVFYIAVFLAFYWLVWGSFQYIMAQGKKEDLTKAVERIKWALIGLVVIFAAYFIAKFASEILPPGKGGLPF